MFTPSGEFLKSQSRIPALVRVQGPQFRHDLFVLPGPQLSPIDMRRPRLFISFTSCRSVSG